MTHFQGGASLEDVQRLLVGAGSDQPQDIRDLPILLLFALYGLRVSEVVNLKPDDIDWESDLLCATRVKRLRLQKFPLLPALGNAVARYLKETRPPSDHRPCPCPPPADYMAVPETGGRAWPKQAAALYRNGWPTRAEICTWPVAPRAPVCLRPRTTE